jgi:hypothetical protein
VSVLLAAVAVDDAPLCSIADIAATADAVLKIEHASTHSARTRRTA